jgi:hypothetical protein
MGHYESPMGTQKRGPTRPDEGSQSAADRDLLAEPIKEKQKKSPAALELWMKRVHPIVKLSTHNATEAIKRIHKQITQFFSRRNTEQQKITKKTRRSLDRSS